METLIVVARHRGEYHGTARFRAFGTPPSNGFGDINCRTFQSGTGVLHTPIRTCSTTPPVTKTAFSPPFSLETASPHVHTESKKHSKKVASKIGSLPIPIGLKKVDSNCSFGSVDGFHYSELWAGPAYSNSPPPSSLPIPNFSVVRPKRTVSLDLPSLTACEVDLHPIAKSAPASPTGEHALTRRNIFHNDESATQTLRRILNLDITDE